MYWESLWGAVMNCNKKSACTKVRELYGNIINWSFFIQQLEENPAFFQGRRTILRLWQCLSPCQPTCQFDSTQGHIEHRDVSTHLSAKVLVCLSIKLEWLESRCPLTSRKLRLGEKTVLRWPPAWEVQCFSAPVDQKNNTTPPTATQKVQGAP